MVIKVTFMKSDALISKRFARQIAVDAKNKLKDAHFNNPVQDEGYDLYQFTLDGYELNIFAYIGKQFDKQYNRKWYSVYGGTEYKDGDTIQADFENSTMHLTVAELTDAIYSLVNAYADPATLNALRQTMEDD